MGGDLKNREIKIGPKRIPKFALQSIFFTINSIAYLQYKLYIQIVFFFFFEWLCIQIVFSPNNNRNGNFKRFYFLKPNIQITQNQHNPAFHNYFSFQTQASNPTFNFKQHKHSNTKPQFNQPIPKQKKHQQINRPNNIQNSNNIEKKGRILTAFL